MREVKKGKLIKKIEIYTRQYSTSLAIWLLLFNALLWISLIEVVSSVKNLFSIILTSLIFIFCLVFSIITFVRAKKMHKYELYENAIVLHSLWDEQTIDLNNVIKVVPNQNMLNKYGTNAIQTLTLFYLDKGIRKVTLKFVKTNVYELAITISTRIAELRNLQNDTRLKVMEQNFQNY